MTEAKALCWDLGHTSCGARGPSEPCCLLSPTACQHSCCHHAAEAWCWGVIDTLFHVSSVALFVTIECIFYCSFFASFSEAFFFSSSSSSKPSLLHGKLSSLAVCRPCSSAFFPAFDSPLIFCYSWRGTLQLCSLLSSCTHQVRPEDILRTAAHRTCFQAITSPQPCRGL